MNKFLNSQKFHRFCKIIIGILIGLNFVSLYILAGHIIAERAHLRCEANYQYINVLFRCGHTALIDKKGYELLRNKIKEFIESEKSAGRTEMVGVWFRDLESGPTFGIGDRDEFIPASLLKLPLAITFYEMAQDNPAILQKKITFSKVTDGVPNQTYKPEEPLKFGVEYSIDELISRSIVFSDNNAAQLLYEYLLSTDPGLLSQTYRDLGILEPGHDLNLKAVNVKAYGSIFRLLYNASYLNPDMSEKLLDILVKSGFPYGLRYGVPDNILIAQKFGERYLTDGGKQLHDCGIIFYPGNPYQLCVMTQGKNFTDLQQIIGQISKMTYDEFDSRNILKHPQ